MALFRTPLTPINDLLPSLVMGVCVPVVLAPDVNFFLIHANRGYLVDKIFLSFFLSPFLYLCVGY